MVSEDDQRREWFCREVLPLDRVLRAYAVRFCRHSSEDAEDLVHETFAKLIVYPGWRGLQNPAAFAMSTLRNVALTKLRHKKIISMNAYADMDRINVADDLPLAERVLESRDELRLMAAIIAELPEKCRRVFVLRKICGLSHSEIAVQLDLSVSTVEKHVMKGFRQCQDRMREALSSIESVGREKVRTRKWRQSE